MNFDRRIVFRIFQIKTDYIKHANNPQYMIFKIIVTKEYYILVYYFFEEKYY